MKLASIAFIVLLSLLPLGAATRAVDPRATTPAAVRSHEEAALALINFPWQQLEYEIVFLPPQPGLRALIISKEHRIEVYARPEDDSILLAYDIAHELGHAIDLTYNTKETRKKWMEARGIDPETPWFGCNRCTDFQTPAGDFAETFAFLLLGPGHFSGRIAPPPTMAQVPGLTSFFPNVPFNISAGGFALPLGAGWHR